MTVKTILGMDPHRCDAAARHRPSRPVSGALCSPASPSESHRHDWAVAVDRAAALNALPSVYGGRP